MINKLIEKIQKTHAPIVVGLDPMLNYVPEHIQKRAFAEYGETLEGAAEAIKGTFKRKICSSSKQHSRKCDECKTIYCGNYPGKDCAFGCAWKFDGAFTGD